MLWVDKESFEILIGSLEDLKKRGRDGTGAVKKLQVAPSAGDTKRFGNIRFKDLKVLGLLGCGGFGAVFLVEDLGNGETYALKNLSKGYVVTSGMQNSVISEKNVQLMCDSPFVVKLYETFNSAETLHLLLELALGGELYATYNKKNLWGQEPCAKFYIAGTVLAFEHLHSKKIIFRDLKPENLLLNEQGHVKLTDMGLAKVCPGKTFTTCGTPDYFAPELIASKGHNLAVDWWTLGILTFELCAGHPPFESTTPMQIYAKVEVKLTVATVEGEHLAVYFGQLAHLAQDQQFVRRDLELKNVQGTVATAVVFCALQPRVATETGEKTADAVLKVSTKEARRSSKVKRRSGRRRSDSVSSVAVEPGKTELLHRMAGPKSPTPEPQRAEAEKPCLDALCSPPLSTRQRSDATSPTRAESCDALEKSMEEHTLSVALMQDPEQVGQEPKNLEDAEVEAAISEAPPTSSNCVSEPRAPSEVDSSTTSEKTAPSEGRQDVRVEALEAPRSDSEPELPLPSRQELTEARRSSFDRS
eukprot:g2414.t1